MQHLNPHELNDRLRQEGGQGLVLLDVREPWEFEICRISGSHNLPMADVPRRLPAMDRDGEIVVICHHGIRSRQVAAYLEAEGFERISNLEGGLDAWAREVDTTLPLY